MTERYIVGIDPSINHTGYGIIRTEKEVVEHIRSGVIKSDKELTHLRYGIIATVMQDIFERTFSSFPFLPNILTVVEMPTFENSARGHDLVKKKGLTKLCIATGVSLGTAVLNGSSFAMVTAKQWKGTVGKPLIRRRVEEIFPQIQVWQREDEWEALGIALWANANPDKLKVYSIPEGEEK